MKVATFVVALMLCALIPAVAHGQCQIQTSTNYVTSYATALDSSGNDLVTSVVVDGSASMSMSYPCPDAVINQFNQSKGSIMHSPYVLNQMGSSGGWTSGPSFCAQCYGSYQSNLDSGPTANGQEFVFSWGGQVNCAMAGLVFLVNLIKSRELERAWTKEKSLGTRSNCYWLKGPVSIMDCNIDSVANCTAATSPPDMHQSPTEWQVYPTPPPNNWWTFAPCERPINPTSGAPLGPWACLHGIAMIAADDSPGNCTHNPT